MDHKDKCLAHGHLNKLKYINIENDIKNSTNYFLAKLLPHLLS